MSNPAPTLNQINAFNATQGTTIDFNIIGGTEVIRSNKIYIYDLSDNSLICTHLYVSTESIHELPPNTSSSIVYASGKSSADFTNNTQYYAQIQTFTDVGGTQGGSGLSIAKLFWCLPTPTLTLSTIPTTISTTSYNVSATYTPNTSGGATNEIQEFQFNLYSAIGALLQTSGVVLYGEGVDLSYNFSGLEVDSTYYVTLDVTTTQGMNVSAQSNTFTVSIDTPTMGSASVVNNGCDGYISVTSNLSSEYEHEESVEAGEIMSFTTDSVNDITELDVDFEPVQNGTPWMSAQDTEPYMFRPVPTQTEDFGHESDTIIGGTVGANQLIRCNYGAFTNNGITYTPNGDGSITINGTATGAKSTYQLDTSSTAFRQIVGHKYLFTGFNRPSASSAYFGFSGIGVDYGSGGIFNNPSYTTLLPRFDIPLGETFNNVKVYPQVIDLTAYFGSTIADYVYTLEQGTAGAGVAWLRANAPQLFEYQPYDAGSLVSVSGLTSHDMVGFNQWDEEMEEGFFSTTDGSKIVNTNVLRSANIIPCLPSTTYYVKIPNACSFMWYDANKNYVGYQGTVAANHTFTTPSNVYYMNFGITKTNYGASTYDPTTKPICINLSDASLNGTYKPYTKHSYPLDSTLTLRGVPKLVDGKLKYDGDIYHADGSVDRRLAEYTITGNEGWQYYSTDDYFYCNPALGAMQSGDSDYQTAVFVGYTQKPRLSGSSGSADMSFTLNTDAHAPNNFYVRNTSFNGDLNAFKSYITGKKIVFLLATPTTETADPYTNPQIVDPSGTEEYVGSPIPVGHKTTYQRICPITGWTGCEVDVVGVNLNKNNSFRVSTNAYGEMTFATSMFLKAGTYKASISNLQNMTSWRFYFRLFDLNGDVIYRPIQNNVVSFTPQLSDTYANGTACVETANHTVTSFTIELFEDAYVTGAIGAGDVSGATTLDYQLELGSTATPYTPYNGQTYPVSWQTEAGTVYGGTVDVVSGVLTVTWVSDTKQWNEYIAEHAPTGNIFKRRTFQISNNAVSGSDHSITNCIATYNVGTPTTIPFYYVFDNYFYAWLPVDTADDFSLQLVYELATPIKISLTPQQMQTLSGQNNIWSNTNGGMYLVYQPPITSLLVKRRDVADVSGKWLTLYSTPITQASDMDFTFIDFLNQYGKTYQYALVPVLAQDQSGVVVQIEGGYTVSDNVDSIFDGVYIADQTNVERVKAGVGYGNIDMNQGVGSITPIGSKYPTVITNSQNQYHNGSIRGTIVPNDFYSNGNLSRIDMVNKRDELEQFLTNKRAKIIKDWNGKMWLVMIMSNVACSFDDNYGMGMVSFSADWLEVGDPTNQQDLYNAGLINVGGV